MENSSILTMPDNALLIGPIIDNGKSSNIFKLFNICFKDINSALNIYLIRIVQTYIGSMICLLRIKGIKVTMYRYLKHIIPSLQGFGFRFMECFNFDLSF